MKSIDIKSLLIGILGTALVMVLMGQSGFESKVISILQEQYEVELNGSIGPCFFERT